MTRACLLAEAGSCNSTKIKDWSHAQSASGRSSLALRSWCEPTALASLEELEEQSRSTRVWSSSHFPSWGQLGLSNWNFGREVARLSSAWACAQAASPRIAFLPSIVGVGLYTHIMEALLDGGGGSAAASGVGGEILTVQAGTFANLVAAHLWTCQTSQFVFRGAGSAADGDDDDGDDGSGAGGGPRCGGSVGIDVAHDCLFREGKGALDGRVTYLPRTVVVELTGLQPKVAASHMQEQ